MLHDVLMSTCLYIGLSICVSICNCYILSDLFMLLFKRYTTEVHSIILVYVGGSTIEFIREIYNKKNQDKNKVLQQKNV